MAFFEQALGDSGKEKLPLNRKKPPGSGRSSHLLQSPGDDVVSVKEHSKPKVHALCTLQTKPTAKVASYPLSTPNTRFNTKKDPSIIRLTK